MSSPVGPPSAVPTVCARHPDRATGLRCTRCERPSCPECLREASVGYQCVECVARGNRGVRRAVTVAGAEPGARPLTVWVLIAANVAMFVLTAVQAGGIERNFAAPIFRASVLTPDLVGDGEWWRVATTGFLHAGLLHLAANMLSLWIIGRDLEVVLGRGRFLAVYLLSLLGGSCAVMLFELPMLSVAGASGAVFGLMGALAVVLHRANAPIGQVLVIIAANFALGLWISNATPIQISWIAHLGGLVVGAAATAALVYAPPGRRIPFQVGALAALGAVLLALIAVRAGLLG